MSSGVAGTDDGTERSEPNVAVAVCIPTADRPEWVEALLRNLTEQALAPDRILVVDGSRGPETGQVCENLNDLYEPGRLRYEKWDRGLTLQRRRGIEMLQRSASVKYVCMLDDDVTIPNDFLSKTVSFLESADGREFGGVCGYETEGYGKPFTKLERLYSRLGLFDGELRAGRWLYCGEFLELSKVEELAGVFETSFLPGGITVWNMSVFDDVLPPIKFAGYRGGEDKHLSLRVGLRYRLGVLGEARIQHHSARGGARPGKFRTAYLEMRNKAIILKDCDPKPTIGRYLSFLGFNFLNLGARLILLMALREFNQVTHFAGSLTGLLHCTVAPPRSSPDSMVRNSEKMRCVS